MLMVACGFDNTQTAAANGDTRTLSLHHVHTNEELTVTYKRNGRYDADALKKIDWIMRDWRKNESTRMDPQAIDILWSIQQEVGNGKPIWIICGYRSPGTNAMLRRRSSGVAEFSQHTQGKAIDFYIPGASLEQTREMGLKLQRGGVGYYPASGSPFVHMDVGSVRHWPRMNPDQLARVFPDGRTVHIPSDGQPLRGYALALADIENRGTSMPSRIAMASAGVATGAKPKNNLLAAIFNSKDEAEETTATAVGQDSSSSITNNPAVGPMKREPQREAPRTVAAVAAVAAAPAPARIAAAALPAPVPGSSEQITPVRVAAIPMPPIRPARPSQVAQNAPIAAATPARPPPPQPNPPATPSSLAATCSPRAAPGAMTA